MLLNLLYLTYHCASPLPDHPEYLRGCLATRFNEYTLLHQHTNGNQFRYRYPLVQYRILNDTAVIVGINEGAETLKEIYRKNPTLRIGATEFQVMEYDTCPRELEFGITDRPISYEFITPWLALNQENYTNYCALNSSERHEKLRRILVGNILSAGKGLDYQIPGHVDLQIGEIRTEQCRLKSAPMIGFRCQFVTNFEIPDLLGLGKSVSRGFGAIRRLQPEKYQIEG